jgi:putative tryptophan/tyrosine transport system substrate-binding protein
VEGKSLVIQYRWGDGNNDRLPALAKELAGLNPDLIVSVGGPSAARAAKAATTSIPVVFVSGKAVEAGIVASLARPGGNLTGLDILAEELDVKRLELLRETLPKAMHVAVLWNPGTPEGAVQRRSLETAAGIMGVKLRFWEARRPGDLGAVFAGIGREHFDALLVSTDPMFTGEVGRIVAWTAETRLPAIHFSRLFPQRGGLMSYGADIAAIYGQAATYVDRILKGAKPADLPVAQPTNFELVINGKTARTLGLAIPPSVLARAGETIE